MCIYCTSQKCKHLRKKKKKKRVWKLIFVLLHSYSMCMQGCLIHALHWPGTQQASYLISSVCCARSCCAAARAAIPSANPGWQLSKPRPTCAGCWSRSSAVDWTPAPPAASTGGSGGWKAGEACCFLGTVLPLRGLWSINLLAELQKEETAKTPLVLISSQESDTTETKRANCTGRNPTDTNTLKG